MNFLKKKQKLKIVDDDCMIALVNIKKFNETLPFQQSWTWKQLNNFILKKNNENLIVFSTGSEEEWTLEFLINEESKTTYFRKFEQNIEITDGALHLISWGDLTSTLQFTDTMLPGNGNEDVQIKIKNSFYRVVVKQLFNPEDYDYDAENKVNFIIELSYQNKEPKIKIEPESLAWTVDWPNDETLFLSNAPNEFDDFLKKMIEDGNE